MSNPDLKQLQDLLHSRQFEEQFIQVQTREAREAIDQIHAELRKAVEAQLKPLVEAQAAKSLSVDDVNAARRLGKRWGDALRTVHSVEMVAHDASTLVDIDTARHNLEGQLTSEVYAEKFQAAEVKLNASVLYKRHVLERLQEQSREVSPELVEALEVWGLAPNVKGEYGAEGKGFNSGVIHYFEYRASAEKNGRFADGEEVSVPGFVAETRRLKSLLDNPSPTTNKYVEAARMLADAQGQRRLFLVTKDKELVIAFQRAGAPLKLISVFPGQGIDKLAKAVDDELHPKPGAKPRLNSLQGEIAEVDLS